MQIASIELYDLLKVKIGETEAKSLVAFVEQEVENKFNEQKNTFLTKDDKVEILEKIANTKAEIIKWLFVFIIGQTGIIITVLKIFCIKNNFAV